MDIKQTNQKTTYLNLFDIADSSRKEVDLSKILAYVLAKDRRALGAFLKLLGIGTIKGGINDELLKSASICIEKSYKGRRARTDIEIKIDNPKVFIIVECKVKGGKATREQFEKYKFVYTDYNGYEKYFVFVSHQSPINLLDREGIRIVDTTWKKVIDYLRGRCGAEENSDFRSFIDYYTRSYSMSYEREILVQDVSIATEIDRFEKHLVYRRKKINGAPLYFAPYFTRSSGKKEYGISAIAKILGIITTADISWKDVEGKCQMFLQSAYPNDEQKREMILAKWKNGVFETDEGDLTYYFLDEPVQLQSPLVKKNPKDSKNWIGGMIGKNRCVTFADFIRNSVLFDNNP